jgi:hypothetical protein
MSTSTLITTAARTEDTRIVHTASRRFDWLMAILSLYFVGGLYLDGWAHQHGKVDESFFTPWHAVLYSGQILLVTILLAVLVRNVWRGSTLREALPRGYNLSLAGVLLWFIGGPGDLIWHTLFGIEESVEALYSPTHLLLALGIALAVSGPLRAAYYRSGHEVRRLIDQLPMILSFALTLSVLTFFIMIAHPLSNLWGTGWSDFSDEARGITGIMLDIALLMGAILLMVRQWKLAPGALTITFAVNAILMGFLFPGPYPISYVAVRVLAGAMADVLLWWLKPAITRPTALRAFATLVPVMIFALYFLAAHFAKEGILWTTHLWAGSLAIAGAIGFLLSLLVAPPATPPTATPPTVAPPSSSAT